ncbi:MAG TPA: hypothetical protein VFI27_21135 [candidate division Zixibacteria bacterium]|nr:hypothetical protein [candidate division Zixibacteria bacterium]
MSEENFDMDIKDEVTFGEDEITGDDKLWALLGYIIGFIALLALLLEDKKNRPFVRYHAIQSLMLWAIAVVLSITACLWILPWAYGIYVGILAYQGQWVEIPVLTDFAKNQGWIK